MGESLGFGLGASLLGSSVVGEDVGFDEGFRVVGLKVGDVLVGKSVIGDSVTGFRGFGDGVGVGCFVVVIKVGSLLVGDTNVGESLGFGLGASLLGSSVVGEDVGFDEGFRVVGLKVGDVLVGKSVIRDAGFNVGPSLGIRVNGFVDGLIDGRLVVVIKESVTIKVGSLLARGSNVDESLGFGFGTSLLGSSVIGI